MAIFLALGLTAANVWERQNAAAWARAIAAILGIVAGAYGYELAGRRSTQRRISTRNR
jgi:hypothetical protein